MQVLAQAHDVGLLRRLVDEGVRADYVYMYPPRQTYARLTDMDAGGLLPLIEASLSRFDNLNLYVHVPFCRQICGFCNLFATNDRGLMAGYVDAVLAEAEAYAAFTSKKQLQTLYIGGGTPSLLAADEIERLVHGLNRLFSASPAFLPRETALEVDPATVDVDKLSALKTAGINRINLGYQSLVESEVRTLGRKRSDQAGIPLLESALEIGFDNICVDLIYGLRGQTDITWIDSLQQVIAAGPPTICAYALTSRPFTGYQNHGYKGGDGPTLNRRFRLADEILQKAGYSRETHVRWVRGNGGYIQKVNHWAMQNILGFGAGARAYTWDVDYRNGYSVRHRTNAVKGYLDSIDSTRSAISDAFLMSHDERTRKAALLNIQHLDRTWYRGLLGTDPLDLFSSEFQLLEEVGLCTIGPQALDLTEKGIEYRDLSCQALFSEDVRRRLQEFNYDE